MGAIVDCVFHGSISPALSTSCSGRVGCAHVRTLHSNGQPLDASVFGALGRFRFRPIVGCASEAFLVGLWSSYCSNRGQHTARVIVRPPRSSYRWKFCLHPLRTCPWLSLGQLLQ